MIGYVTIGANDHTRAQAFYDAVLGALGMKRLHEFPGWTGYGREGECKGQVVWVCKPINGEPARAGNGMMVGLTTSATEVVDAFHAAALASGGTDEGAPGPRPQYGQGWYAAYVRDPEGNKLACVKQGGS